MAIPPIRVEPRPPGACATLAEETQGSDRHDDTGVHVGVEEHRVVVSVHGDIDVATASVFSRALTEALTYQRPLIVIDLRHTGCFGSTAIIKLIPLVKDATERDIRVELSDPSPLTRQVIDLTRVTELPGLTLTPID